MENLPEFINTETAASVLRSWGAEVAKATLETLRCTGKGPRFVKLGSGKRSRVRYRVAALREWLEGNERTSTADPKPRARNRQAA